MNSEQIRINYFPSKAVILIDIASVILTGILTFLFYKNMLPVVSFVVFIFIIIVLRWSFATRADIRILDRTVVIKTMGFIRIRFAVNEITISDNHVNPNQYAGIGIGYRIYNKMRIIMPLKRSTGIKLKTNNREYVIYTNTEEDYQRLLKALT